MLVVVVETVAVVIEGVTAVALVMVVMVVEGVLDERVAALRVVAEENEEAGVVILEAEVVVVEEKEEVELKGISTNVGITMPAGAWISNISLCT